MGSATPTAERAVAVTTGQEGLFVFGDREKGREGVVSLTHVFKVKSSGRKHSLSLRLCEALSPTAHVRQVLFVALTSFS